MMEETRALCRADKPNIYDDDDDDDDDDDTNNNNKEDEDVGDAREDKGKCIDDDATHACGAEEAGSRRRNWRRSGTSGQRRRRGRKPSRCPSMRKRSGALAGGLRVRPRVLVPLCRNVAGPRRRPEPGADQTRKEGRRRLILCGRAAPKPPCRVAQLLFLNCRDVK